MPSVRSIVPDPVRDYPCCRVLNRLQRNTERPDSVLCVQSAISGHKFIEPARNAFEARAKHEKMQFSDDTATKGSVLALNQR